MKKFGYIINPKETRFYELSGGFNRIKLSLPVIKDEVMKISEIYDKDNRYIGDVLSAPVNVKSELVKEKLLNYMEKTHLDFICLGDGLKNKNIGALQHDKLITGVHGLAYISTLFIEKYLKELYDLTIYEAEIVIAIDDYSPFVKEMVGYISSQSNYVLLTGKGLPFDEDFFEEVFDRYGMSLGFCEDYTSFRSNWHVFVNLSFNVQLNKLAKGNKEGIVIDPLFLIHERSDHYKIVNNLGLYSKDIVFFNKLNRINNAYSPQFIESLVRIKNSSYTESIYARIEQEIIENDYTLIDE